MGGSSGLGLLHVTPIGQDGQQGPGCTFSFPGGPPESVLGLGFSFPPGQLAQVNPSRVDAGEGVLLGHSLLRILDRAGLS